MVGVLYSINRPHTDNIKSGLKLWEIRKSKPNIPVPFPAFIYETKKKGGCGKVIGEFICDKITTNHIEDLLVKEDCERTLQGTCLNRDVIATYLHYQKGENFFNNYKRYFFYGLHISDLKIYDKPKEISEFRKPCYIDEETCYACQHTWSFDYMKGCDGKLTRPPQSWCYVED